MICGTGALMSVVAKVALAADLTGFEFASGIPGSIGGAIFMNAGAYGGEMKDIVESVTLVKNDGSETISINAADLDLSYRHSILEDTRDVAVTVTLKLKKGNHEEIAGRMAELTKRRNEKTAGSVSKCRQLLQKTCWIFCRQADSGRWTQRRDRRRRTGF